MATVPANVVDACAFCDQAASTHSAPICALHILPRPAIVRRARVEELGVGRECLALGLSGHRGAEDFAGALDAITRVLQHLVVERVAGLEAGEALQVVCNGGAFAVSETDSATNRESIAVLQLPVMTTSTPGTRAMSWALAMPTAVSTMQIKMQLSLYVLA